MQEFKNKNKKPEPMAQEKTYNPSPVKEFNDLSSKRTKTRFNRSNYTRSEREERRNRELKEPEQNKNEALYGQFKKQSEPDTQNDYFYADNYKEETKHKNHNYSNILHRELGQKQENVPDKNLPKLIPSVHYSEYKGNRLVEKNEKPVDKYELLMENLSQKQQAPVEDNLSLYSRTTRGTKIINVEFYLQGDRYVLQKIPDEDIKRDLINTGFQVGYLVQERQPVTNKGKLSSKWKITCQSEIKRR